MPDPSDTSQVLPTAPPPPQEVKVRTLKSDLASIAASGGGLPKYQNVKIVESGDTGFLKGEIVNRFAFAKENRLALEKGGKEAQAEPVLLGITKASLASNSFRYESSM